MALDAVPEYQPIAAVGGPTDLLPVDADCKFLERSRRRQAYRQNERQRRDLFRLDLPAVLAARDRLIVVRDLCIVPAGCPTGPLCVERVGEKQVPAGGDVQEGPVRLRGSGCLRGGEEWRSSWRRPLPSVRRRRLFFVRRVSPEPELRVPCPRPAQIALARSRPPTP